MDAEYQRRKFTELRFEYYVSGRTLWFSDQMPMGALLLGYSVETHLKHALVENGIKNRKDLYKHDIPKLFSLCQENDIYKDVSVSEDLLLYISDMLHQRYPRQSIESIKKAEERGHSIGQVITLVSAYDDLIIQLDDSLRNQLTGNNVCIGLMASHFVNRSQGRVFFHSNVAALRNMDFYRRLINEEYNDSATKMKKNGLDDMTIQYNLNLHNERLNTLNAAPDSVWIFEKLSTSIQPDYEKQVNLEIAKYFNYPGKLISGV